jgi:hypothetical protein
MGVTRLHRRRRRLRMDVPKTRSEDVKIEGICSNVDEANRKVVAKALITRAVNLSFQLGNGGR